MLPEEAIACYIPRGVKAYSRKSALSFKALLVALGSKSVGRTRLEFGCDSLSQKLLPRRGHRETENHAPRALPAGYTPESWGFHSPDRLCRHATGHHRALRLSGRRSAHPTRSHGLRRSGSDP